MVDKPCIKTSRNLYKKLAKSHVIVIGCGALGTTIANNLVKAGIGYLHVID